MIVEVLQQIYKKMKNLLNFQARKQDIISRQEFSKEDYKGTNYNINKFTIIKSQPKKVLNKEQQKIKDIVLKRNIENLIHFTPFENLESILRHGLVPISVIERMGYKATYTDSNRLDDEKDAVSLSISFPNYRYFYTLSQNRFPYKDWVVIELEPDILWEKDCAFCKTNAANINMRNIPYIYRKGAENLEELFADNVFKVNREKLSIPKNYTTDPQAEVLVYGIISPKYIKAVYYNNNKLTKNILSLGYNNIFLKDLYFKPRKDYSFWIKQGGYYGF